MNCAEFNRWLDEGLPDTVKKAAVSHDLVEQKKPQEESRDLSVSGNKKATEFEHPWLNYLKNKFTLICRWAHHLLHRFGKKCCN